jgi:hypothetical protein
VLKPKPFLCGQFLSNGHSQHNRERKHYPLKFVTLVSAFILVYSPLRDCVAISKTIQEKYREIAAGSQGAFAKKLVSDNEEEEQRTKRTRSAQQQRRAESGIQKKRFWAFTYGLADFT